MLDTSNILVNKLALRILRPEENTDTLLDPLFTDPSIICMVGNHYYPVGGVNLNEANLSEFIALVQDEKRNIPAMLITCPDVITPEKMADETLGNASRSALACLYFLEDSLYFPIRACLAAIWVSRTLR